MNYITVATIGAAGVAIITLVTWFLLGHGANREARAAARSDARVVIEHDSGLWRFSPRVNPRDTVALVLFPDKFVDPRAYAPIASAASHRGFPAYIIEQPARGIFGRNQKELEKRIVRVLHAPETRLAWVSVGDTSGVATSARLDSDAGARIRALLPTTTRWVQIRSGNPADREIALSRILVALYRAVPRPAADSNAAPHVTRPIDTRRRAISATAPEIDHLAANLEIPVRGVARSALRDTYTSPRVGHSHEAIDILAPRGTAVVSSTDGRLLKLFNSKNGGIMVYATDSSEQFILLYGHLDHYAAGLREGMPLKKGQLIGYVGTTGNAPANTPHLHFGILRGQPQVSWSRGTAINPYPLLKNQTGLPQR